MATIKLVQYNKNPGVDVFTGSISVSLPATATAGNLLFLVLGADKNPVSLTVPTGFTKIQSEEVGANAAGAIAYKISDGTEQTFTCTLGSSTVSKPALMVFEYDGFTGTPLEVSSKTNSGATNVGSVATSAITTTSTNTTVFTVAIIDSLPPEWGANRTWSNGFTEIEACGVGSGATISVAYKQFTAATAGITSTHAWTASTDQIVTFAVAFVEDGSTFSGTPHYVDPVTSTASVYQRFSLVSATAASTYTCRLPRTATAGNLLVAVVGVGATSSNFASTGWTVLKSYGSTAHSSCIAYKVATGTEKDITFTWTTAGIPTISVIEYQGIRSSSFLGQYGRAEIATAAASLATPTITTTSSKSVVLVANVTDNQAATSAYLNSTWSNSFNKVTYNKEGTANVTGMILADKIVTGAGTSVTSTFTNAGTTDEMQTYIVEFASADGTAATATDLEAGVSTTISWKATGAVTDTSAQVILASAASATLGVKVYVDSTSTLVATIPGVATTTEGSNFLAKLSITGLTANTKYKYVPYDTIGDITAGAGFFTTFPPAGGTGTFTWCHYSCNSVFTNARFTDMINKNPLFILCMGDWHYGDVNSATESLYHSWYTNNYTSTPQSTAYASIPLVRIWDDHDFSGNDSNAASTGHTASAAVYRKFMASYTLPDPSNLAVYQSFVVGRVRYVLMDVRSERVTSGTPGIISTTQMAWVKSEITAARDAGQVVVLGSGVPWISAETTSDNWGNTTFASTQRDELASHIRQTQMNRSVFLIAGDAHMLAWDDGTNNIYGTGGGTNFRVFQAAALGRTGSIKGGPYSGGSQGSVDGTDTNGQYASCTVTDTGGRTISFQWVGKYGAADTTWATVNFTLEVPRKPKARSVAC